MDQVIKQLNVDAAAVLLSDPHSYMLNYASSKGFRTDALRHTRLRPGESYAGRAALGREIVHISDLNRRETDFLRHLPFLRKILFPITESR